jgi:hypothetical protein
VRKGRAKGNIYLHYVFDLWANQWRSKEAASDMIIVRYADDMVLGFEHEADARRFLEAMRERLAGFALARRSQRACITLQRMDHLAKEWLPTPRILHPWPEQRFAAKHPRWEPYAGKPHVRFCAGGAA